jgi:RNA recognition motif-containing protein
MVAQTTPAHAPLNDAFKYFIANIDFYTTAAQVEEFFSQFGSVNHVKLLPPQPGSSGSTSGGGSTKGEQKQLHRGYGFLFMLDEESCVNVDQYVSSFPENKIIMLGRKGVHVKRQLGMGRGYDYNNTSNGWNGNNAGGAGNNQYHPSWAQYYGTPYNTINHQNPQQMAYYPANYYTSPTTTVTVGPAGQAQPYLQPAMVSSTTTYTQPQQQHPQQPQQQQQQQQQYPTDANYAGSVYVPQTTPNQVVPPSHQQHHYQQQQLLPPQYDPLYANPQIMHHHPQPPHLTQPPPPPLMQHQQQHLPLQQQHPQQAYGGPNRINHPPNNNNNWGPGPMNGGGRGSGEGGGGKWQQHQDNRLVGGRGGGGGGRGLNSGRGGGGGRNGRDGRMDRPY